MIIGLTSLARAGKDTVARILCDNYGFVQINMSDCLRDELISSGKPPTKMNMSLLGDELRRQSGMDVVIRKTLEKANQFNKVVITGVRSIEEVAFLKQKGTFFLVTINASLEKRFSRRQENDPETLDTFKARDENDIINKGLDKVMKMADFIIDNNSSIDELKKKIESFYPPANFRA